MGGSKYITKEGLKIFLQEKRMRIKEDVWVFLQVLYFEKKMDIVSQGDTPEEAKSNLIE